MKKTEIRKKIKELLNNKDYEFRFLMAGVYLGNSEIKCGICEEMVDHTVQTLYSKTDDCTSIVVCANCNQIIIEKRNNGSIR
jgi:hypothetical protein